MSGPFALCLCTCRRWTFLALVHLSADFSKLCAFLHVAADLSVRGDCDVDVMLTMVVMVMITVTVIVMVMLMMVMVTTMMVMAMTVITMSFFFLL